MQENLDSRKYLVAIRDSKTEVYGPLVSVVSLPEAQRMFSDLCCDNTSAIGRHPEDFSLFCLGRYDETTGVIASDGIVCVANGVEFVDGSKTKE